MVDINILTELHFTNKAWILLLPCIMMAMDIVTGLTYAWVSKTFSSAKMRAGLGKKFGELSYIVIGMLVTYGAGIPPYIVTAISAYIILMEIMSILENCDKLGAPIPKFVKQVINNVNDTLNNDDLETIKEKLNKVGTTE